MNNISKSYYVNRNSNYLHKQEVILNTKQLSSNKDNIKLGCTYEDKLILNTLKDPYTYNVKGEFSDTSSGVMTWGEFEKMNADFYIKGRDRKNDKINQILKENDISLNSNEKLTLTIDKDCKISVSGIDNEEKRFKIEGIFNNEDNMGFGLLEHVKNINAYNGKNNQLEYRKWYVNKFLMDNAGQKIEDLKFVDGEIIGANEKLIKIFNSTKEQVGQDLCSYYSGMFKRVKELKMYGDEKIPDMKVAIDFQNGCLIDIDVERGFSPEQLKLWYNQING